MLAIGEGARAEAIRAINELGATNIILRSVKPVNLASEADSGGAIRYGLTLKDLDRISASVPTVLMMAPMREHRRRISYRAWRVEGRVVGITPDYQDLNDIRLQQGRFIEHLDVKSGQRVAVLGAAMAEALFPLVNPMGKSIRVGEDQYFQVIGVARPRAASAGLGQSLPPRDYSHDVYIPFSADQKRFGENIVFERASSQPPEKVEVSQITISVRQTDEVKATARIVEAIIGAHHRRDETALTVPLDLLEKAEQTQRIFTWVLTAIASISLLVGGIGIMNIMLATVTERTREIGIRRALGARRADITWQFLIETSVLSGTGGVIGVVLGLLGAAAAAEIAGVATLVQPWSPLLAFGISVGVGLIFGIYPARRAARMDPIQALRHE
jgi:putative ABC transport system permease protein